MTEKPKDAGPQVRVMSKEDQRRMRTLIHQKAAALTRDYELGVKLNALTEQYYDVAASDVDADGIIDGLFGRAGVGGAMTLGEYLAEMNSSQDKVTVELAKRPPMPKPAPVEKAAEPSVKKADK